MRTTITVESRFNSIGEQKLQCTIEGIFKNVARISKKAVDKHGLDDKDMRAAGFTDFNGSDKKNYIKYGAWGA